MSEISVAIIGAGSRALNVIEHLAWRLSSDSALPGVVVHLIDPGEPCAGVHVANQSSQLLTNTLASQVTMFSPTNRLEPKSPPSGPSFTEWARRQGYRRFGTEYRQAAGGEEIGELDYLPRAMLGEYLRDAFRMVLQRAPKAMTVKHHRTTAIDVSEHPRRVHLENGDRIPWDALIIATGHCELQPSPEELKIQSFVTRNRSRNSRLRYIGNPYPTSRLAEISRSDVVLVQGLGLTAYDDIADLTAGRGGGFVETGGGLRYIRSGEEPLIRLFSRQSLPYGARGVNQKGVDGGHVAQFLTRPAVDAIRARSAAGGMGKLDFLTDILPLIRKDMAFAYRCAEQRRKIDVEDFRPTPTEDAIIDRIFEPKELLSCGGLSELRSRVVKYLRDDLAEAVRGNVDSPLKAATDAIRDLRDGLSAAIEFGGLTPESHRYVVEVFVPLTNRITFGPPLRRNAELLALIEAGVVDWAGGAGARIRLDEGLARFVVQTTFGSKEECVAGDVLVTARVFGHRPLEDVRPLSRNLVERGIARPFCNGNYHPHGLDVDRGLRLLRADGSPNRSIWGIGFVTEGPRFHTHALPRPGRRSSQLADAARLVDDLLASFASGAAPHAAAAQAEVLAEEGVR